VEEGMRWLSYTYLFQRMRKNPLVYGLTAEDVKNDPELVQHRMKLISNAGREIDKVSGHDKNSNNHRSNNTNNNTSNN
jgi:hypothetical protein